jgi:hypothetical protein
MPSFHRQRSRGPSIPNRLRNTHDDEHERNRDAYYVEVERDGDWAVERRRDPPERRSWPSRIVDAIFVLACSGASSPRA